jgi:tetratricopeptide (TPR) repeat protein
MKRILVLVSIVLIFAASPVRADEFDENIARAREALEKSDEQAALRYSEEAIQLNPQSAEAYFIHGRATRMTDMMTIGQHVGQAMKDLEKAIELKPDYAEAYFARGNILVGWAAMGLNEKETRKKAIEAYSNAIKYDPGKAAYYVERGEQYGRMYEDSSTRIDDESWQENRDKAKADYIKAVELDPNNIDARIGRAKYIDDEEESMKDLNFVLEKKPENWDALALRYEIYKGNSEWEKEAEDLKPLIKKSLAEHDYFIDLADAHMHLDQYAEALDVLDKFQARLEKDMTIPKGMEPKDDIEREFFKDKFALTTRLIARNQVRRGYALAGKGDNDAAFAAFDESLKADPTNAEAYCARGEVLQSMGKTQEALEAFKYGLEHRDVYDAKMFESRMKALEAQLYIDQKQLEPAAAAAKEAAEKDDEYDRAVALDARMRAAKKDFDGAIDQYEHLIKLKPRNVDAYVGLAKAQQSKKDVDTAIESFEKALSLDPNRTEARLGVAFLYGVQGNKEKSREAFDHAVANASPEDAKRGARIVEVMLKGNPNSELLQETLRKLQEKAGP